MHHTDTAARTPWQNTPARYGKIAKTFHWLTALLILTALPLGVIANQWPYDSSAQLAAKAVLFSAHKTVGIAAFFLGIARIIWAVVGHTPHPLESARAKRFAAQTAHLALYIALVVVPLSGWLHHAATTGFAPIWWPFGQSLPFVPQSQPLAEVFASLHWVFTKILLATVLLHIAAALKHHLIDRDATLRRMLPGTPALPAPASAPHGKGPFLAALAIWGIAFSGGMALGLAAEHGPETPVLAATTTSDWRVETGSLEITVTQLGNAVAGSFADWTADIAFDPDAADGVHGQVEVIVSIPSLGLGGVTSQALQPEFFNADTYPTARFAGPILAQQDGYAVEGILTLVGQDMPATLPFALDVTGDTATATGRLSLDRRDFGIGPSYQDEATVGFTVDVDVTLTAIRQN